MKKQPGLFDVNIEDTEEEKASKFISSLLKSGFIGRNKIYLNNYINANLSIALGDIKKVYKTYVIQAEWTENKFRDIMLLIIRDRRVLKPAVFLQYGVKYDEGKLEKDIKIEKRRQRIQEDEYNKNSGKKDNNKHTELSDDEQQLLDYIAEHGGND